MLAGLQQYAILIVFAIFDAAQCRIFAVTRKGPRGYLRLPGATNIRWKWDTCEVMNPTMGSYPAQYSPFPYYINISAYTVKNSETLTYTLTGKNGQTFQSFMLEARDRFELAVGTYRPHPGSAITLIDCPRGRNNSAIHADTKDKESLSVEWIPHFEFSGKVIFSITVAEKPLKFWLREKLEPVTVTW